MFLHVSIVKKSIMLKSTIASLIAFLALTTGGSVSAANLPFKAECKEMQSHFNARSRGIKAKHFEQSDLHLIETEEGFEVSCSGGYVISSGKICKAEIGYYDYPKMFYTEGPRVIWDYASSSKCRNGSDDSETYQRLPLGVNDIAPFTLIGIAVGVCIVLLYATKNQ